MSQHDYVIDNQTFPNTRTDINNALAAIVSTNAGATAPTTTYAYQLWYDTANNLLKMRNADDDAWISLFTFDQTADTAEPLAGGGASYFLGENGASGDTTNGLGDIIRVHEEQLDTDVTIPVSTNSAAFGPLIINATLTINGNFTVV